MTIYQIECACAIAYYNQKVRELELAKAELVRLIENPPLMTTLEPKP